jgi:hypothetical protein
LISSIFGGGLPNMTIITNRHFTYSIAISIRSVKTIDILIQRRLSPLKMANQNTIEIYRDISTSFDSGKMAVYWYSAVRNLLIQVTSQLRFNNTKIREVTEINKLSVC